MIVHGTTLVFLVSGGFLFGLLCGVDLEKENGSTPTILPAHCGGCCLPHHPLHPPCAEHGMIVWAHSFAPRVVSYVWDANLPSHGKVVIFMTAWLTHERTEKEEEEG